MSSAGSDVDYSFDRIGVVSDRLRTTLRGLGVAAPVRLYGRFLTRCDRDIQQTRLLMSCKRWRADDAEFPLCAFLTEEEKEMAHGAGLPLAAYDRGGDAYELTFRFLECNVAYRLIYKWGDFLRHNGLVVAKDEPAPVDDDVMLDLWMFRPPGPGGKVGMVMLHYRRGDAAHADAALDEVEQKRLQLMLNNGDAPAAADAVMEDVVGDANEEGDEDAGVIAEVAAAAPAPSSPSEPSGGGAIEAAEAASSPSEPDGVGAKEARGTGWCSGRGSGRTVDFIRAAWWCWPERRDRTIIVVGHRWNRGGARGRRCANGNGTGGGGCHTIIVGLECRWCGKRGSRATIIARTSWWRCRHDGDGGG
jgi:hypothetical protein